MDFTASSPRPLDELREIGQYRVVRELSSGQSWLASAGGGRQVVLKVLDDDCLWKGQLHPNVRDRLGRVRELAHTGVANLHGVERDAKLGLTFLVWDYLPGRTLDEAALSPACGGREFLGLVRELLLSIEVLHARGIIHGAIKSSNVIVTEHANVSLTHISPLLYSEIEQDSAALFDLLDELIERRGASRSTLARLIAAAREKEMPIRQLAAHVGAMIESREEASEEIEQQDRVESRQVRRKTLAGALATAMVAIALFGAIRLYAQRQMPRIPVPPAASPAAMQEPVVEKAGPERSAAPASAVMPKKTTQKD